MKKRSIVSLSGGMDSATVLSWASKQTEVVHAIGFKYGSKHNQYENESAQKLADHYLVPFTLIDLSNVGALLSSNLLKSGGEIPEGHYEDDSMSQTVVPGRNMIFASILAGIAWSKNAEQVFLGIHSGDHAIYPDCRPAFASSLTACMRDATDNRVEPCYPFLYKDKTTILEIGFELGTPYELTRTCYKDQPIACGRCGSCQERLEAFRNVKKEDPIEYISREILPK